jgi:hypothetical protein
VERILARVRKNPAERIAGDSGNSLSDHRLHTRAGFSFSRRHLRITALESVYDSNSHSPGHVIADPSVGRATQEKTITSEVDGNCVAERSYDGLGCKIHSRPDILVANGIGNPNYALKG